MAEWQDIQGFMDDEERRHYDSPDRTEEERKQIRAEQEALWNLIPDPTENELQEFMRPDDWQHSQEGHNRDGIRGFYIRDWKKKRKGTARIKLAKQKARVSDLPEKSDVDKAVESIEQRHVQSPEEQAAILSEERKQDRGRYVRMDDPDRFRLWKEEELLRRRERLADREEASQPRAYQVVFDELRAAAIAEAEEEARQRVRRKYREEEEKAKSNPAAGQAELLRQREQLREEDRRRADLRNQEKLVERQEALGSRSYQGPFDMLDAAADENARQRVRDKHEQRRRESQKPPELEHPAPLWAVVGFLRKWTALGGVFLLGATWTMIQIDEYALAAVLLAIGMFAFSVQIYDWDGIDNHRKATLVLKSFAVVLIVGALGFFGAVIVKKKGAKPLSNVLSTEARPDVATPAPSAALPSPGSLQSGTPVKPLHEYFEEEVNNGLRDTLTHTVKVKGKTIPVQLRLFLNFEDRAEWLAFYIPDLKEPETFQVCMDLLNNHEKAIHLFVQTYQGKLEVGPVGGRMTQIKDLRFTGYIRFYHERILNQSELDLLTEKARKKGLSVEFRGTYYQLQMAK